MSIKEEFEKERDYQKHLGISKDGLALWAAKWMAKKCAEKAEILLNKNIGCEVEKDTGKKVADKIRQLVKELHS